MHPDLVEAWARILHALPNAQFLVKDRNFSEPANAQRLLEIFGIHGLAHRIEVVQDADTYGFFGQLDLLLLSAPLPAATQVLDALWSGVLPLALSVSNRVGRQAFALLDQLGLSKAVLADTLDDYVSKAIALAQDTAGRATLRSQMRNLLAKVPALDPEVRAKDLSAALDLAWEASKSSRGI